MAARILRAAVTFIVLALAASCGGLPRAPSGAVAPDSFVAADIKSVDMLSAATGQVQRVLMPTVRGRLQADGVALEGQALFVTYAAGPSCTGGAAGCGPVEGTCGAEVDRLDLITGVRNVVWKVGPDARLSDAEPSPDGTRIAALESPCKGYYENQHLVIRSLADGREESIGAGLPRCHELTDPHWVGDGSRLLVFYAAASPPVYQGPDGTCSEPGRTRLIDLDAAHGQSGLKGGSRSPSKGCQYQSMTARNDAVYVVVSCGTAGRVSLEHLNDDRVPDQTWALGSCGNSSSIAVNPSGDVLVAAYQSCATKTVLYRVTGGKLSRVSDIALGTQVPDHLTW